MPNQYEMLARAHKVDKLLDALDAEMDAPATEEDLRFAVSQDAEGNYSYEEFFIAVLKRAAIRPPSQATIDALVERIRERDRVNEKRQ